MSECTYDRNWLGWRMVTVREHGRARARYPKACAGVLLHHCGRLPEFTRMAEAGEKCGECQECDPPPPIPVGSLAF